MKINLVPHLCWLIAVLIAIFAFLTLKVTNGNEVNSYISFASSIASLILAIVAIFYSIISNNSLSNSLSSIQNLGSIVEQQTGSLNAAATKFVSKVEEFTPHFSAIPSRIEALGQNIQERLQSLPLQEKIGSDISPVPSSQTEEGNGSFFDKKVTLGLNTTVYLIAMSAKHEKNVDLDVLFEGNAAVVNYVSGCLAVIEAVSYKNVRLAFVNNNLAVLDHGKLNIDVAISKVEAKSGPAWDYMKVRIAEYFGAATLSEDNESESGDK